jgi:hypothetical protein
MQCTENNQYWLLCFNVGKNPAVNKVKISAYRRRLYQQHRCRRVVVNKCWFASFDREVARPRSFASTDSTRSQTCEKSSRSRTCSLQTSHTNTTFSICCFHAELTIIFVRRPILHNLAIGVHGSTPFTDSETDDHTGSSSAAVRLSSSRAPFPEPSARVLEMVADERRRCRCVHVRVLRSATSQQRHCSSDKSKRSLLSRSYAHSVTK